MCALKVLLLAASVACGADVQASETYTFHSPDLAGASFTISFTTPAALPDGAYQWDANDFGQPNSTIPAGTEFNITDGFTTLTDPGDLIPSFDFMIAGGVMSDTYALYAEDPSYYDPLFGYSVFYGGASGGVGSTQLEDRLDPDIVGLPYDGMTYPVVNGGAGYFTYSSSISAVPEPAPLLLMIVGLFAFVRSRALLKNY